MREYSLKFDGFERKIRRDYEGMRWAVWQMMMPHFKKGQAPHTPQAFVRFPWEEAPAEGVTQEDCKLTEGQINELNRMAALHNERTQGNG